VRSTARSSAASASGASSRSACPAAVSLTSRLVRRNCSVPRVTLELLDLVAQRRLGDVEARGGSAEVELLRDG